MSDVESPPAADPAAESAEPQPQRPLLRVIDAGATPEQVAAIVAVLAALGGGEPAPPAPVREWNAPHRLVRTSYGAQGAAAPGARGAWRRSGLPR